MALYIPHSVFHLARLLYVRPETFGPYYICVLLHRRLFIFIISVVKLNKDFTKALNGFVCQKDTSIFLVLIHKATYITVLKTLHRCYVADASSLIEYDIFTENFRLILQTRHYFSVFSEQEIDCNTTYCRILLL